MYATQEKSFTYVKKKKIRTFKFYESLCFFSLLTTKLFLYILQTQVFYINLENLGMSIEDNATTEYKRTIKFPINIYF